MKKATSLLIASSLLMANLAHGDNCLKFAQEEMNELHSDGACCGDAVFTSISSSMIGWGFGLALGIGLLTGLVHNSHAESKTSKTSGSN